MGGGFACRGDSLKCRMQNDAPIIGAIHESPVTSLRSPFLYETDEGGSIIQIANTDRLLHLSASQRGGPVFNAPWTIIQGNVNNL